MSKFILLYVQFSLSVSLFNLFMSSSFPFEAAVYFISSIGEHNETDEEDESPPGFRESNSVWGPDGEDEEEPDVSPH